jgi:hypothetical protein
LLSVSIVKPESIISEDYHRQPHPSHVGRSSVREPHSTTGRGFDCQKPANSNLFALATVVDPRPNNRIMARSRYLLAASVVKLRSENLSSLNLSGNPDSVPMDRACVAQACK